MNATLASHEQGKTKKQKTGRHAPDLEFDFRVEHTNAFHQFIFIISEIVDSTITMRYIPSASQDVPSVIQVKQVDGAHTVGVSFQFPVYALVPGDVTEFDLSKDTFLKVLKTMHNDDFIRMSKVKSQEYVHLSSRSDGIMKFNTCTFNEIESSNTFKNLDYAYTMHVPLGTLKKILQGVSTLGKSHFSLEIFSFQPGGNACDMLSIQYRTKMEHGQKLQGVTIALSDHDNDKAHTTFNNLADPLDKLEDSLHALNLFQEEAGNKMKDSYECLYSRIYPSKFLNKFLKQLDGKMVSFHVDKEQCSMLFDAETGLDDCVLRFYVAQSQHQSLE